MLIIVTLRPPELLRVKVRVPYGTEELPAKRLGDIALKLPQYSFPQTDVVDETDPVTVRVAVEAIAVDIAVELKMVVVPVTAAVVMGVFVVLADSTTLLATTMVDV